MIITFFPQWSSLGLAQNGLLYKLNFWFYGAILKVIVILVFGICEHVYAQKCENSEEYFA